MAFQSSVVSYPNRGPYGQSSYRGNTTGLIVKDFLEYVHPNPTTLFCDPAEGGGTSRDVAKAMGIRYQGLDLRDGFNLLQDDLGAKLGEAAQTVFFHPPYHGMIQYSGNMWGQPHADDLSRCASLDDFLSKIQLALWNIYDALANKGHYAVLMGTWRNKGELMPLGSLIIPLAPGKLREEIIKVQNNVRSDSTAYSGRSFVPIMHEKLLIIQKDRAVYALDVALAMADGLSKRHTGTWKSLVQRVMMKAGRPLSLEEVYTEVEGTEKAKANPNWQAKVRQTLGVNPDFCRVERGVYQIKMPVQ